MHQQYRPIWATIDRAAIKHNYDRIAALCPSAKVMAVIKADAYGHGMLTAASALPQAEEFGVNTLDEVVILRENGYLQPTNLFAPLLTPDVLRFCASHRVRPTIFDHTHLSLLDEVSDVKGLEVWLKVDTGMGRLGFAPAEIHSVYERLNNCSAVSAIHLMSHLGSADTPNSAANQQQFELFRQFDTLSGVGDRSILNSAGVVSFASQAREWVRPGVMLYGISPTQGISASDLDLQPVMNLYSRLISVRQVQKGHPIGYGGTYRASKPMTVGIVAAGYGDGYPRLAPTGTPLWVNGQIVPSIGRVSMDMLAVDLSAVPIVNVGDVVQLWGNNNPIEDVAHAIGTIAYELTCRVLPRVERQII